MLKHDEEGAAIAVGLRLGSHKKSRENTMQDLVQLFVVVAFECCVAYASWQLVSNAGGRLPVEVRSIAVVIVTTCAVLYMLLTLEILAD